MWTPVSSLRLLNTIFLNKDNMDSRSLCHTKHYVGFYTRARDAMLARVIAIANCLSVRLSVTRRYCVKTKKASVMISSQSGSSTILVFCCQIASQNSKGFPREGAPKKGGVGKFSDFLALRVNISKTVADTSRVTISD